ncbi:MAG: DUF1456 family protein, partial [Colwellia sp.]|nr:DUF1456 family protein [Colwellia sp.]
VDFRLSKPELTAFARKPEHKNYRICKDQVLRNLLQAIDKKYHVARTAKIIKDDSNKKAFSHKNTVKKSVKSKDEPRIDGARPNASAIYVNPKSEKEAKDNARRKTLKLRPEDIYKQSDK